MSRLLIADDHPGFRVVADALHTIPNPLAVFVVIALYYLTGLV